MKSILLSIIIFLISGEFLFSQNYQCDDFTIAPFNNPLNFSQGDTISGLNQGNQLMIANSFVAQNQNPNSPGFYMVDGSISTQFNGQVQSALYELYGGYILSDVDMFTVNGSQQIPMDTIFPLTVNGVYLDIDTTAPNVGFVESVYLVLSGSLSSFEFFGFESGIKKLCMTDEVLQEDCLSLSSPIFGNTPYYYDGDTIVNNQGGIELMTAVDVSTVNYVSTSPGLYFIDAGVQINLVQGTQYFSSLIYGFYDQFNQMSIEVNNSQTLIYLDGSFPQYLSNGIVVDLDTTVQDFANWEVANLTVTGNLSSVKIIGFESGLLNVCAFDSPLNVGLKEQSQEDVNLFPNPGSGIVNLTFKAEVRDINIFNVRGVKQHISIIEKESIFILDFTGLPKGVYIVELVNPKGSTIHKRFVKY